MKSDGIGGCAGEDRLDVQRDGGIIQGLESRIAHADLEGDGALGRFSRKFNAIRNIGDQPTHQLPPGFVHIPMGVSVMQAPMPNIAQGERGR